VSPDGTRVAFFEHPSKFDDRGAVAVVDLAGKKTTLSDGYAGLEGLAWSRDGREVLFSDYKVFAVTLSGVVRELLASAGGLTLYDVSADGRWLASRDDLSSVVWVKPPGGRQELNLSWLDASSPKALSRDGGLLLFTEFSGVVGNKYATVVRKTDGSPVVRLGEGSAQDLSSDGSRVVALVPGERAQLMVYPTGPGEVRKIDQGPIVRYQLARWFADGGRLLICGNEAGRPSRCYVQDVGGGPPRAITPEDTRSGLVSPDGSTVVARRGDAAVVELYPVAGGAARAVPGVESDDLIVRWSPDGRSLLVTRTTLPPRVEQLDVQSGKRTAVPEIAPVHADAGLRFTVTAIADDPAVYAYTTLQRLSSLFMVQPSTR
jgi:Tol biopolymer transport system component